MRMILIIIYDLTILIKKNLLCRGIILIAFIGDINMNHYQINIKGSQNPLAPDLTPFYFSILKEQK